MSQAQTLLDNLNDAEIPSETDYIVIDDQRFITVPEKLRRLGVQHDHNIETVAFMCPRFWDGHDMSAMKIYINYMCPNGTKGKCLTENLQVDGDTMTFDWTISGNVTQAKGTVSFLVCIMETDDDGNETRHWNSELNQQCTISSGLECDEIALVQYPDIITYLLVRMDELESGAGLPGGSGGSGGSGVYILSEGESIEDVPPGYDVVIDPYANDPDIPLTRGDIQEIVDEVLSALPTWTGGSY